MSSKVHPLSLSSFNENHELYDKVRPDFDNVAVQRFIDNLGLKKGSKVLELACGTGKFTKSIANREYDLLAVEPSIGMLETFKKNFPAITVKEGSSYSLPVDDNSQDAVIAAQAFHWFADRDSLKEISRVLKPGGKLGLIWNYDDCADLPERHWQRRVCEYCFSLRDALPQYDQSKWRTVFEEEDQFYFKVPIGEERIRLIVTYPLNKDLLWFSWKSRSYITAMTPERQAEVRSQIIKLFEEGLSPEELEAGKIQYRQGVHIVWVEVNK
jgi:ubiquinone/menaquinone biosynthesis C-methylase UbiE